MTKKPDLTTEFKQDVLKDVTRLTNLMIGVIVVLAIAIGGLLTNYLAGKQASYENLQDEVQVQNAKLDALNVQILNLTKAITNEQEALQETN